MKSAFNEKNQPYTEVFREWLKKNNHTFILTAINWEHDNSEIEINFRKGGHRGEIRINKGIHDWNLFWSREILEKIDKEEKNLELSILIAKWFCEDTISLHFCGRSRLSIEKNIKELEEELTDYRGYRRWKKEKKLVLILGIILAFTLTTYLMWPNSEKQNKEKVVNNNDWTPSPHRTTWL